MFLEWIKIFKTYSYVVLYVLIFKYVCIYVYIYVCVCIDIDIWISEYMKYKIIMWYFNKSILTYVSFLYSFLCPRSNHFQISWLIYISLHIFEQYFYISTFWSLTYKYYILIFLSYGRLGFSIPYLLTHTFLYSSSLYHCIINLITMQFHYAISKEKISRSMPCSIL